MTGSKSKTTQSSTGSNTNTYGYMPGAESADIDAMRNFQFERDPRLPHTFARAYQRASDTYKSPTGGYTTPQLRDSVLRATAEDLGQEEGQAYREENYGHQALKYAQKADIAQMTAPRFVQTGGSSTSSGTSETKQSPSVLDSIVKGGSAIGSALMM